MQFHNTQPKIPFIETHLHFERTIVIHDAADAVPLGVDGEERRPRRRVFVVVDRAARAVELDLIEAVQRLTGEIQRPLPVVVGDDEGTSGGAGD